ncbi:MAG: ATP synthase F1 subunit delta [Planctomycetales bacterium]|nr:ATP synthase F1 subunit delta [Planctomycetales bacterium]
MPRSARHIIHEIYSDVMFELAEDAGLLEPVMDDLESVGRVLQDEPEFLSLLTVGHIREDEKVGMVRRVFKGRVRDLTLDFLCVLARRNRMSFLHGIGDRYQALLDERKNLHRIEITLAKEPTDEQVETIKRDIREAIRAEIKLSVTVNPEIIGGIIIRKGDMVIDNSVRTIMNRTVDAIMTRSKEKSNIKSNKESQQ